MEFKVLGRLEVFDGDRQVDLRPKMQKAVLARLVSTSNRVVPLDQLVDELWSGSPPATATVTLQGYISGLRRALEPGRTSRAPFQVIVTETPGYVLRTDPECVDAMRFEILVREGRRQLAAGQPGQAREALWQALSLWRGEAYSEFAYHAFAQAEIARLTEIRAQAEEDHAEAQLALGEHAAALPDLERLAAAAPLRERRWELLALALYRSGRQSDALRRLDRARRMLREELGVEPGPGLRRIENEILAHAPTLEWGGPSPDAAPVGSEPPHSLPVAEGVRRTPLVGRRSELARLQEALTQARQGHCCTVLVSGDAGIGKTTLLEQLAGDARASSVRVAWGRCQEVDGVPPYWPWREVIRALLDGTDPKVVSAALGDEAGHVCQLSPELKELVGEVKPPPASAPREARFRLHRAVSRFLSALSKYSSILVVIDDLQWADIASRELFEVVTAEVSGSVLVVGTYRSVDGAGETLADLLGTLARHRHLVRLPLDGLTPAESRELVVQATGARPSDAAMSMLHDRTEGNPFFVIELARLLESERRWEAAPDLPADAAVPPGVADVVRRRLRRLPARTTQLLEVAAVIGRQFDFELLAAAAGKDEDQTLDLVDVALAAGIVTEDRATPGAYLFAHALTQEAIYQRLSAMRSARHHADVGLALERLDRAGGEDVMSRARHFFAAMPVTGWERAFAYAMKAADWAMSRLGHEEAERQLRRALRALATQPADSERAARELDVQMRRLRLLTMLHGYCAPEVTQLSDRVRTLASESQNTRDVVAALGSVWAYAFVSAAYESADRMTDTVVAMGSQGEDPMLAVAADLWRGTVAWARGRPCLADQHLRRAMAVADELDREGYLATAAQHPAVSARVFRANAVDLVGDHVLARRLNSEARELAHALGDRYSLCFAMVCEAGRAAADDDAAETLRLSEEAHAYARTHGFSHMALMADIYEGWAQAYHGMAEEGSARIRRSLNGLMSMGARSGQPFFLGLLASACIQAGKPLEARRAVQEALAAIGETGERFWEVELLRLHGELLQLGDPDGRIAAEAAFRRAMDVASEQGAARLGERAARSLERLLRTESSRMTAGRDAG